MRYFVLVVCLTLSFMVTSSSNVVVSTETVKYRDYNLDDLEGIEWNDENGNPIKFTPEDKAKYLKHVTEKLPIEKEQNLW